MATRTSPPRIAQARLRLSTRLPEAPERAARGGCHRAAYW